MKPVAAVVKPTYRVRYSLKTSSNSRSPADVQSIDLEAELDQVATLLPEGACIMYIEDLVGNASIHWTRWPKEYRPGFGSSR